MDSVSLISTIVSAQVNAAASQRQVAVAAQAVRSDREVLSVLMEAIQQSAAYGSNGQVGTAAVAGTRFAATA